MAAVLREVRCCCHPGRLWGTVELPGGYAVRGQALNIAVSAERTMGQRVRRPFVRFEVDEVTTHARAEPPELPMTRAEAEVAGRSAYLALKKPHGVTIEDLRMLHTFVEAR